MTTVVSHRPPTPRHDERGWVVFPSVLVTLTVLALVAGLVYFVMTREPADTTASDDTVADPSASATVAASPTPSLTPSPSLTPTPTPSPSVSKKPKVKKTQKPSPAAQPSEPGIDRGAYLVAVLNNTTVTGLAAQTAEQVRALGWQVSGTSNWRGNIPSTTVYYPAGFEAAAEALARDLGIARLRPSVAPMKNDRLTVILSN